MWALEHPSAARTGRLFADTPAALLAVLAVGAVASLALARLAVLPPPTVAIAVLTAGHGALLATALAWARQPSRTAALAAGLIGLAAVASGLGAFGPLAYLAPPLWICVLARRGRLAALGLRGPVGLKGVAAGLLIGTFLRRHLLVSASGTLRLHVRVPAMRAAFAAAAYDVRANVLPAALVRRAYVLPVVPAGLRFGLPGGVLTAASAALLNAPCLLPEIERSGLTPDAAAGLVTLGVLGLAGALSGTLRTHADRHRKRHETLVDVQRALADDVTLDVALTRLRATLAPRLGVDELALAARDGAQLVVAGARRVAPGSLGARVLARGAPAFVRDVGGGVRARQAFVTPLVAGGRAVGLLAVERRGEIFPQERAALEALGAHVGLALCRVPLALAPAIEATADLFRLGTATHPIEIECDPALPPVDADPAAVERVLTNLISNAIKYSPTGSTVRVKAQALAGVVAIEVADSGRGIAAEALGRVFEPYYRAPDVAGVAPGTGIGLAVVKALVEAHGGAVRVDSVPMLGTRVTFVLPSRAIAASSSDAAQPRAHLLSRRPDHEGARHHRGRDRQGARRPPDRNHARADRGGEARGLHRRRGAQDPRFLLAPDARGQS